MKNKLLIVLLMQFIIFCISITAKAQTFTMGEFTYKVISASERTVQITNFNQTSSDSYVSNRLIRIPSKVSKDGIYFTVTEISYLFSSLDKNIKTLIIPSTIKKIGSGFYPYCADEVFLLTDTPPEGYNRLRGVKNLYIIGENNFPFGTEMVSITSGQEKVYDGDVPHFSFFSNLIGISKATITEPYKSSYLSNAGIHSTSIRYEFTLDNNKNVPGYSAFVTYDPKIECYKKFDYTILPKTLTVNCNDEECEYGNESPNFTYSSVIGFVNDESLETLGARITLTSNYSVGNDTGEYPIIADINNENYNCISIGKLLVNKAPLSVIPNNTERKYGEDNPTFQFSCIGLRCNDLISDAFSLIPTVTTSATKISNVGEYPIKITGGTSKNYEIMSYENGVLTITKATAILTPINSERYYFEENPSFDYTISGLRNGDSKSCLTVLPQFICAANKLSNVGTYTINASEASATNYNFEYGQGSLTIYPRQLTASVSNYSRVFGKDNPSFEIEYTGFVNNENASILSQPSVATCSATKLSDVGSYPITISGGSATNYIITNYNNGILTIEKAEQNIIWNQDLSNIDLYSQVELQATSDANLPVTYEISPNNVATIYNNAGKWYLDCYGSGAVNIRAIQNGDKNHNAAATMTKTLVVFGGGDDPSNPQIYLNIEEPGTLPTLIAENRKFQIKNLRLTGYLNGTDINYIREMCGSDSYGNTTPGVLETLDISGCTIVDGGRSYYKSSRTTDYVVGDNMFYNCKILTTLHLPNNSVRIGNNSLADCNRLSVISIPNSVKEFGIEAFKNDISLIRIPMPDALTTIKDLAFMGCNGLMELTIPSGVSFIGDGIVKDCQNIERIRVESENSNFRSVDGVLFNKHQDRLIIFPVNHSSNEYTVPEGVKTIAPYAFVNSKKLKSVSLPSSMSIIGQDAFIGCVNLQTFKVQAITPPVCQNDCFESVSKTRCELQVPMGCRSSYWVAPIWSEFNKIIETDFSGINNLYNDDVEVEIINGKITINGCHDNQIIHIYQINGTLIFQDQVENHTIQFEPSSKGVYLVVVGNKTYKIKL